MSDDIDQLPEDPDDDDFSRDIDSLNLDED